MAIKNGKIMAKIIFGQWSGEKFFVVPLLLQACGFKFHLHLKPRLHAQHDARLAIAGQISGKTCTEHCREGAACSAASQLIVLIVSHWLA